MRRGQHTCPRVTRLRGDRPRVRGAKNAAESLWASAAGIAMFSRMARSARPVAPDPGARRPHPSGPASPAGGAARGLRSTRLRLAAVRAAQAFWPALALVGLALAVLLSGLLPRLPGVLHVLVLAALAAGVLGAVVWGARSFRWPDRADVLALLDRTAPGGHRPLTAAADRLAVGTDDPVARAIWIRHQTRMAARAAALRSPPLPFGLAGRDPRALRLLPLVLLAAAGMAAWPDPAGRLLEGLSPRFGAPPAPGVAQVWISPPAYTGRAPLSLESTDPPPERAAATAESTASTGPTGADRAAVSSRPLIVPQGSDLLVVLRGGAGNGRLDLGGGTDPMPLEHPSGGGQRLEQTVSAGDRLRLTQDGRVLIDRPMTVLPDRPPRIGWQAAPAGAPLGRLTLAYDVADDYGVTGVQATVTAADGQVLGDPFDLTLPGVMPTATAAPGAGRDAERRAHAAHTAVREVGAHPWAGTRVTVRLTATDGLGQTGHSTVETLTLPARVVRHPVARRLLDMRRALVMAPERARAVAAGLDRLAEERAAYDDALPVFLALKAATARFALLPDGRARTEDLAVLWSIAMAVEDGGLALARRTLADARTALREAVERGAPPEEIARRLDAVRAAFERLMQDLAEAMPLMEMPRAALPEGSPTMTPQDLGALMEQLERLSGLGANEAARAVMEQLDRMLQALESARPPTAAEQRAMAAAADMMQRLTDLTRRQRAMLDETFRAAPRGRADAPPPGAGSGRPPLDLPRPGESLEEWFARQAPLSNTPAPVGPTPETRRLEDAQRALRQALEDLMADLGERFDRIPDALGRADLAMREAERALAEGDAGAAAHAQARALQALMEGPGQQMAGPGGQPGQGGQGGQPGQGSLPGRPGFGPGAGGFGFGLLPLRPGPGGPGMPGPTPGAGRDPLNRPVGGGADDGSVRVPTTHDTDRAHEILQELRRRANDARRPDAERRYLDRLMDRF